jgi:hypothetical protein
VLSETIRDVSSSRRTLRGQLRDASTQDGQAELMGALSRVYSTAARRLGRRSVTPALAAQDAHAALVDALRGAATSYGAMARAARRGTGRVFNAAKDDVGRQERGVGRALRRLERIR